MKIVLLIVIAALILPLYAYYRFAMRRVNSPHPSYSAVKEVIVIPYKDQKIYGELVYPKEKKADTLIIGSHGFNGSLIYYRQGLGYRMAQEGVAVYSYDFYNGSRHSKSGGTIEYMSAIDEKEQLETVFEYFKDKYKNIVLAGESQGGLVTTLALNDIQDQVKAAILYYPAYVAVDHAKQRMQDGSNTLFKITFKSEYTKELASIDLDKMIENINVPTILIHGDKDRTVDVSYAYKAKELNPKIELHIIKDNDHGFTQNGRVEASGYVSEFMKNLNL